MWRRPGLHGEDLRGPGGPTDPSPCPPAGPAYSRRERAQLWEPRQHNVCKADDVFRGGHVEACCPSPPGRRGFLLRGDVDPTGGLTGDPVSASCCGPAAVPSAPSVGSGLHVTARLSAPLRTGVVKSSPSWRESTTRSAAHRRPNLRCALDHVAGFMASRFRSVSL